MIFACHFRVNCTLPIIKLIFKSHVLLIVYEFKSEDERKQAGFAYSSHVHFGYCQLLQRNWHTEHHRFTWWLELKRKKRNITLALSYLQRWLISNGTKPTGLRQILSWNPIFMWKKNIEACRLRLHFALQTYLLYV